MSERWSGMVLQVKDALDEMEMKVEKYARGKAANLGALKDKKLKGQLAGREKLYGQSAKAAAQAEKWFLPIEGGYLEPEGFEKTYRFQQQSIVQEVDLLSSRKPFDMILPVLGPYALEYTSNGRYILVGGGKGHLAMMDMLNMDLIKEFQKHHSGRTSCSANSSLPGTTERPAHNSIMVGTHVILKSWRNQNKKVALGTILGCDPKHKVGGVQLGKECWMVCVGLIVVADEPLIRPYNNFEVIGDVGSSPIAWPSSCIETTI